MGKRLYNLLGRLAFVVLNNPIRGFQVSLLILLGLIGTAALVYMVLEHMSFTDALYMTIITITTVGFGEVRPLSPPGRMFTIILIILGAGTATTAISNAIGIILGPRLWLSIRQRNLERMLMTIEDHYLVCGYGRMGQQVIRDLQVRDEKFIVVETNPHLETVLLEKNIAFVIGDATRDQTLIHAGIERARGLVAALDTDADNIMTVLTARELNPKLFIVARISDSESESKLRRAGADRVISPYQIGGHRLALAMLRPAVNDFLDRIFSFHEGLDYDVGQVSIREDSHFAGQTVGTCELRRTHNVTILAIQKASGELIISPNPSQMLETGMLLIVIGPPAAIYELEKAYRRE